MSFSADLDRFHKKAMNRSQEAKNRILLELFKAVILDTPVEEGTLRGAWHPSIGSPSSKREGALGKSSGNEAISKVEALIRASRFDDSVLLTNNLPYAYRIEFEGWSHTKAPAGMVRKNVARINSIARAVARSINR